MLLANRTLIQAVLIAAASAVLALGTNAVRSDGIPIIADLEYDIFAACKDTEVISEAADIKDISTNRVDIILYIDARPQEAFLVEHIKEAVNIPYSVLFGASDDDLEKVKKLATDMKAQKIIVYGIYDDPSAPGEKVDFAESLAKQLVEFGLLGVMHLDGGMKKLKQSGVTAVKKNEVIK